MKLIKFGAGTTAKPALQAGDRRYARRVAFKRRDSALGAYNLALTIKLIPYTIRNKR